MTSTSAPSGMRTRQIVVTIAEILCIIGTLMGVGVIGTRVEESSGGNLASDATLLAPAGTAFSIWSVVYLGLAAYTVWQWVPGPDRSELAQRTGYLVAGSMVLNAAWLLVTQQGWIWVSVVVIIALLVALIRLSREAGAVGPPPGEKADAGTWLVRITVGLYLGWVAVATFANIAAALNSSDVNVTEGPAAYGALVALALVVALGAFIMQTSATRWAVAAAVVWGLSWLAVGRFTDEPQSSLVGGGAVVAIIAAIGIAGAQSARRAD